MVGRIVGHCVQHHKVLEDLSVEDLRGFHGDFDGDALEWIDVERAIERRDLPGAPARARVLDALEQAEAELAQ